MGDLHAKNGKTVTLVTKARNSPTLSVEIDWDKHDDSANIQDVDFYYHENLDAYSVFSKKKTQEPF